MRVWKLVAPLALAVVAAGCTKGPAEAALKAAEQAIETARPEAEQYAPEEFKGVADAAQAAREKFGQGDYKAALEEAQEVLPRLELVMSAAAAKKQELTESWSSLAASLPGMIAAATSKVEELAKARKLPKGLDNAGLESAKADLAALSQRWSDSMASFKDGKLADAVSTAKQLKEQAEGLMSRLGAAAGEMAPAGAGL